MRDALRTCLQIAGGLTEATRRRATGAARELLDQAGIDVDTLQKKIGERIPPEVQTLADELVASGRANRDLLLGLIREEADKTMVRVSRLADEVTKVGVILEALERRVRNLEGEPEEPTGPAAPPEPPVTPRERVRVDEDRTPQPPRKTAPAAKKATAAARKTTAPAKKTAAKKSPAKTTTKKTAAAEEAAAAKKTATARKSTTANKTTAEKTAAKKTAAKKASTAKKTAAGKKSTARPPQGKGSGGPGDD